MTGKVALITGSSRGIGMAIAEAFAEAGARVVVSSRDQDACDRVARTIRSRGADAVAIGHSVMMALNCNKEIPESNFEEEVGVPAGYCRFCQTGKCPVGIATQDPVLMQRLDPKEGAERVANFINSMTMEMTLLTRSLGKGDVHSLEPEDLAALTLEASAMARVPLVGTNKVFGW